MVQIASRPAAGQSRSLSLLTKGSGSRWTGFHRRLALVCLLPALAVAALPIAAPAASDACKGPKTLQEATPEAIEAFVRGREMKVLTFAGYSGAGYQEPAALMEVAAQVLRGQNPAETLINIGATADGIGAVYDLAKQEGFTTMGIVSTLARESGVPLSPCVDHVFFVRDSTWGGTNPASGRLSPTSAAMVRAGDAFVAIGGGDVTRDEMLAARQAGKPVSFFPADMNHRIAREKAVQKGLPEPVDFRGSAHDALIGDR